MSLDSKDRKILKDIVETGYKMLLHKYSEEDLNRVIKEVYESINKGE